MMATGTPCESRSARTTRLIGCWRSCHRFSASGGRKSPERAIIMGRAARIHRQTAETVIDLELDLDGVGAAHVETGVGFLDHMLTLLSRHGLIDLTVKAKGDLQVDSHHTVEDVGICLGQALKQAL